MHCPLVAWCAYYSVIGCSCKREDAKKRPFNGSCLHVASDPWNHNTNSGAPDTTFPHRHLERRAAWRLIGQTFCRSYSEPTGTFLMWNCHLVSIKLRQHQHTCPAFLFHLFLLLLAFCRGILQQSPLSTKRKPKMLKTGGKAVKLMQRLSVTQKRREIKRQTLLHHVCLSFR